MYFNSGNALNSENIRPMLWILCPRTYTLGNPEHCLNQKSKPLKHQYNSNVIHVFSQFTGVQIWQSEHCQISLDPGPDSSCWHRPMLSRTGPGPPHTPPAPFSLPFHWLLVFWLCFQSSKLKLSSLIITLANYIYKGKENATGTALSIGH